MRNKHIIALFYVNLTLITLVNVILIYGLFSYLVLKQPVEQINWLIGVFSAEVLGCFVFGWKKIFSSDIKPTIFLDDPKPLIMDDKHEPGKLLVSIDAESSENPNSPNEILRQKGLTYLKEMQKYPPSSSKRKHFAKKAIKTFSSLPKTGIHRYKSLYNIGTVERELGNYSKAIDYYEQAREILMELEINPIEGQKRLSNTEMMIGNVFEHQKHYIEARTQFLKAWKISPDFINALNLFDVSEDLGDISGLKMWFEILSYYDEFKDDNYKSIVKSVKDKVSLYCENQPKIDDSLVRETV